ncbi:MAG: AAA family ATPase, partial [Thermoplasmata archaeon]
MICVTGMPGCGKEEFIKVCSNHGYQITRMGDVVREEAQRRGLPFSDASVGGMADKERNIHGPNV